MANFVIVIDRDRERRCRFSEDIKRIISPVEGLMTHICAVEDFSAIWASSERAPVSQVVDETGAAVVWGEAISETGSERITAGQLQERWREIPECLPAALDGYHAGVVYRSGMGLVVGADLLGLYPVYYYARGEVLLVGSSPELFRYHPEFRQEFNPTGLVGMLLLMHLFEGQTLLQEVKRLGAGNMLVWSTGGGVREVEQYRIPVSRQYFDLSFRAQVDILDEVVKEAIKRHVGQNRVYTLLLSGGLDSRMLGGYLQRQGVTAEALTLGVVEDIEMQCAIPVARSLGFKHRAVNILAEQYPTYAGLQAKWEHCANGFNMVMNWGVYSPLTNLPSHVVLGYIMDAIIGTSYLNWAYSPSSKKMSFDTFLPRINAWGFSPEALERLFRPGVFKNLVEEVIARIREVYQNYSESEAQRVWRFNLYHRQRFHVGSAAWALSFGAWPILPAVDRKVLECAGGMPATTIADRQAQIEILCKQFPKLAQLPLDRNSFNTEPLRPRMRYLLTQSISQRLKPLYRPQNSIKRDQKIERRYYYRIYDINGPGWMAIRQQAEPYRERLLHLFNPDILAEVLPPPHVPLHLKDGIVEASGLKLLLGLMLWSKDHL